MKSFISVSLFAAVALLASCGEDSTGPSGAEPDAMPDSVVAVINVGEGPSETCALPSGDFVYVANNGSNTVSVIRTSDNSVVATVTVGDGPQGICSLPSGEYVYVTNTLDDNVSVIRHH